ERAVDGLPVTDKTKPRYPAEVKRQATRLYETGLSCRSVSEHMMAEGLESPHYMTIFRWAREKGKSRKQHGHRLPLSGADVRQSYDAWIRVEEIARRVRVGTTTVYKRLHEAGAKMRPSRLMYGHVLTAERLRFLYRLRNWRADEIAKECGCNTGTVYNWLRRNDIPLKRPRRTA